MMERRSWNGGDTRKNGKHSLHSLASSQVALGVSPKEQTHVNMMTMWAKEQPKARIIPLDQDPSQLISGDLGESNPRPLADLQILDL